MIARNTLNATMRKVVNLVHKVVNTDDEVDNEMRVTFDEFYRAYPKKRARKKALEAWAKVSIEDRRKILPAIAAQRMTDDWRKDGGKFIPFPASWLNGERWDDQLDSDLTLGTCSWNMHGNRGPEPRCGQPATTEKRGTPYCKAHSERIS